MSFNGLLNQTAALANRSSRDRYGRETTLAPVNIKCRFQHKRRTRLTPTGETITIDALMFVSPKLNINVDDMVTFDGINYKVDTKSPKVGRAGKIHHIEVELIKWQV